MVDVAVATSKSTQMSTSTGAKTVTVAAPPARPSTRTRTSTRSVPTCGEPLGRRRHPAQHRRVEEDDRADAGVERALVQHLQRLRHDAARLPRSATTAPGRRRAGSSPRCCPSSRSRPTSSSRSGRRTATAAWSPTSTSSAATPLSAARVLRVYALVVVGLAPVVLGFMNSSRVNSTIKGALGAKYGGIVAVLAMLACIVWAVYIIFFNIKNDSQGLQDKAEPLKRRLNFQHTFAQRRRQNMSTAEPQLNATETSRPTPRSSRSTKSSSSPPSRCTTRSPSRSCAARGSTSGTTRATATSTASAACSPSASATPTRRSTEAIVEQVKTIQHTSTLYANKPQSDLAEKLYQITPGRLKKSFFTNSGTEANDTAIHAAKTATGRHEIVVAAPQLLRPLRHRALGRRPFDVATAARRRSRASSTRARPTATAARSSSRPRTAGSPAPTTSKS